MEKEELDLWQKFRRSGDQETRNQLVELHLPLVKRAAERMFYSLAGKVTEDELYSAGLLGLMDAVNRFMPSNNVKFATFSSQRIRGSMLDDIRSKDWVPRLCRQAYQTYQKAHRSLTQELQRTPNEEEMMAALKMDHEEFHKLCREMNITAMSSIQSLSTSTDSDEREEEWLADHRQSGEEKLKDQKEFLKKMISDLPEKKRAALIMYYFEEMTLKEISKVLGVTEGRVSQILSGVLAALKSRYNGDQEAYL
ncbi:MAG: FliA/WhiG family RNA polymerase sigma factor [Planctomycetes bacterium]|nr:FliA/WhiG family RNA polymerase sigma factor [Planctomycetota bacterium]